MDQVRFGEERADGFRDAASQKGAMVETFHLPSIQDPHPVQFDHRRSRELQKILDSLPVPCGLFCENDLLAERVVRHLAGNGERPGSPGVAVVGVDDLYGDAPPPNQCVMPLTTIRPPFRDVGKKAAAMMSQALSDPASPPHTVRVGGARLVVRASTGGLPTSDPLVARVSRDIDRAVNCGGAPRVEALSKTAGVAARTLLQHFRAETGRTVQAYILEKRLQRARQLLIRTDQTVAEVAFACGFEKQGALTTHFRKRFGTTPVDFRIKRQDDHLEPHS
jgi:AraC-like DNA-binding protein